MKLFWRRKQTDPEQLRLGTIMFDAMVRKNDWEKSVHEEGYDDIIVLVDNYLTDPEKWRGTLSKQPAEILNIAKEGIRLKTLAANAELKYDEYRFKLTNPE